MKTNIIKALLGLILTLSISGLYAQSPRIKLNQITKDTVKGSVLISSPSDSGMVYSRDFYIAYGADTVLILYGDTLGGVGGGFASVLTDGVTVTGNGTAGNELKVDTATVVSTIQGLVDTLSARGYLTANETITLSGDVTGSGTTAITATVVDDSHNHIISNVDFLQDSLDAKANDSDLANYVSLSGTEIITGAKTFTNTFTQSGGDANFDNNTLYVDESANRVGIGTSSPVDQLHLQNSGLSRILVHSTAGVSAQKFIETTVAGQPTGMQWVHGSDGNQGLFELFATSETGGPVGVGGILSIRHSTGNVGIGERNPSYDLHVVDDIFASDSIIATTVTQTSDARLKTDIDNLDNGLILIQSLNPVTYRLIQNENNQNKNFGFIAQEVESFIPSLVSERFDGMKVLNYIDIIPITVKAIQEQQAIIETQQQEIEQLKTQYNDLLQRIINLEK